MTSNDGRTPAQHAASIIMKMWEERTAGDEGFFLRHLDGNFENRDPSNLQRVHPFDAFTALHMGEEHADSWSVGLTEEQIAFVRAYAWNFCVTYQAHGRVPQEPPIDRSAAEHEAYMQQAMDRAMQDPEVVRLSGDGDAAMEAGDYERAIELYNQAKAFRDTLIPQTEGPGDMEVWHSRTASATSSSSFMSDDPNASPTRKAVFVRTRVTYNPRVHPAHGAFPYPLCVWYPQRGAPSRTRLAGPIAIRTAYVR